MEGCQFKKIGGPPINSIDASLQQNMTDFLSKNWIAKGLKTAVTKPQMKLRPFKIVLNSFLPSIRCRSR